MRNHASRIMTGLIAVVLFCLIPCRALAEQNEWMGTPRVVDGGTLVFGEEEVRLGGLDAPEREQSCESKWGTPYPCGQIAANALRERIGNETITCKRIKITEKSTLSERYLKRRFGGTPCFFADGSDLNAWVVRNGHAVGRRSYRDEERVAKEEGSGIWQGRFVQPDEWRDGKRLEYRGVVRGTAIYLLQPIGFSILILSYYASTRLGFSYNLADLIALLLTFVTLELVIAIPGACWKIFRAFRSSKTHKDFFHSLIGISWWLITRPVVWPAKVLDRTVTVIAVIIVRSVAFMAGWLKEKREIIVEQWRKRSKT